MSMYQSRDVEVKVDGIWLEREAAREREEEKERAFPGFFRKLFKHKGAVIGAVIIFILYSWLFWHPGCPLTAMTVRISPPYCRLPA